MRMRVYEDIVLYKYILLRERHNMMNENKYPS